MNIFISYSSRDREVVSALSADLESAGHEVWYDQELTGGREWWADILHNIRVCDLFIFALSPSSLESDACRLEYQYADDLHKRILPVLVKAVAVPTLPVPLQQLQLVDYQDGSKAQALQLVRTLDSLPDGAPMPSQLPPEPDAPMSPLMRVREQIEQERLDADTQRLIVARLEDFLAIETERAEAQHLLKRLLQHEDLLASTERKIRQLTGVTATGFPTPISLLDYPRPVELEGVVIFEGPDSAEVLGVARDGSRIGFVDKDENKDAAKKGVMIFRFFDTQEQRENVMERPYHEGMTLTHDLVYEKYYDPPDKRRTLSLTHLASQQQYAITLRDVGLAPARTFPFPDNRTVLFQEARRVAVYDLPTSTLLWATRNPDLGDFRDVSSDCSLVLFSSGTIVRAATGDRLMTELKVGVFMPDDSSQVLGSHPSGPAILSAVTGLPVRLYFFRHAQTRSGRREYPYSTIPSRSQPVSPDGQLIARTRHDVKDLPEITLWDVNSGMVRYILAGSDELIASIHFSPDATQLLAIAGRRVRIRSRHYESFSILSWKLA